MNIYVLRSVSEEDEPGKIIGCFSTSDLANELKKKMIGRYSVYIEDYIVDDKAGWDVGFTYFVSFRFDSGLQLKSSKSFMPFLRDPVKPKITINEEKKTLVVESPISWEHAEKVAKEKLVQLKKK